MKILPFNLEQAKAGAKVVIEEMPYQQLWYLGSKRFHSSHPHAFEYATSGVGWYNEKGESVRNYNRLIIIETITREWKPTEVPIGMLIDCWTGNQIMPAVILSASIAGVVVAFGSELQTISLADCLAKGKFSSNNGKTWNLCGVEE